ncbi:hypothetical protein ACIREM_32120 [Streptomyces shenzhenensis]|uniref:hypothetical protein n=1 Tax=Streptomyces shenzhenensis TaxID=943815 RepID=UPI00381A051E
MPVFVRAGGILPTRTHDVTDNDGPAQGSFHGQVKNRRWTLSLLGMDHAPTKVTRSVPG